LFGYNDKHLVREFASNSWNVSRVYKLLQQLRVTGLVDRRSSSGRWCNACIALVDELVLHKNVQIRNNSCAQQCDLIPCKKISKLVDECRRYSEPKQCRFWTWLKSPNSGVHVSQGSAETLVRTGRKTNHHSIAYSLSNISAKNYENRFMCGEVIVW